jgi:dolichol-phosphate mannosyltransferase
MKAVVVVPTYNEARNLPALLEALFGQLIDGLQVLVVDDDSPDGTGRLAEELALRTPGRVEVLHRAGQRGLGLAYVDGFRRALARGADIVAQMDADLSHAPEDVPRLIARLRRCDVAVGSRYVPGGRVEDGWGLGRKTLSRSANVLARSLLGLETRDATSGFKAWRRQTLEAIDLARVHSNGYLFQVEMTYICERLGLRISEMPICFTDRRAGRSKMTLRVKMEAAAGLAAVWRHHHGLRPAPTFQPKARAVERRSRP